MNIKKINLSQKPKVFYGYWIVAAAFLCVFASAGFGFYAFSLFVTPLQTDFGWGRGEVMAAFTIYFLVMGAISPFIGRVIDRYGARKIMFIGALITGLGFILLRLMDSLWFFYIAWAVVGIGAASTGPIPATTIVSNWFKKRRGTAIGIMSTGIGAGGLIMAPLIGGYLIPNFGWETSYLILAVFSWVLLIPLALFVVRTKPADMGLFPDGIKGSESDTMNQTLPSTAKELTSRMALATTTLWLIGISFLTGTFSMSGATQNQVPHLEDIGFPVALAAGALGVIGLGSFVGKFFFGWLCDRIPAKYAWAIAVSLQLVGIIILMNIKPTSPVAIIWLYAILIGLGAGGWLPTMSMLTSTTFGLASYGAIFGILSLMQSIGTAIGPSMAGYMYDATNTYHGAFIILIILSGVALATILVVRRPKSL